MELFLILTFLFCVGSVLGWCLEVLYRRFTPANKEKRWINPGFLEGPYLPLYGFGLITLYLMANLEETFVIERVTTGSKISLFIVMAIVMTALEYVAGLIFIKGMQVKLWDYTHEKFNLQGIICLRFSCYWAILGAVYYFLIHPYVTGAVIWFMNNIPFAFFIGMFYGVFMVDLAHSLGIVTKIRSYAKEKEILVRYEELKLQIRQDAQDRMNKIYWIRQFKSDITLREHLERYIDLHQAFVMEDIIKRPYKK